RILGIDASAARAYPGVVAVLTAEDVPVNEYGIHIMDQRVLAQDKVRSVGDPVALVLAESERTAGAARRLIVVEYQELPAIFDPREAMAPGAPLVHEEKGTNVLKHFFVRKGDVAAGFAQADVIVEGYYHTPHQEHAYLQPEAGVGLIDELGRVTVYVAAQWPHDDVHQIAHALNLPETQVRECVTAIGGAFGGREDISLQILVALGAYKTRRPVKLVYTREESIRGHGKRHPFFMRHRTAATRDGLLVAAEIELISDAGAYASTSIPVLANATSFAAGPYQIPNVSIDTYTVYTNNLVTMAMRGFGSTQPPIGYESQMDKLAEKLGLDPVEFRARNVLVNGSIAPTGCVMEHGVGMKEALERVAQAAGWQRKSSTWTRPQIAQPKEPNKRLGLGVACSWKNVGYSFGFDDKAGARVELYLGPGGAIERAVVNIGASDVGQGVETALAQIAAETLQVPIDRIEMVLSDTAVVPNAGSSSASRHVFMSGSAVLRACQEALGRLEGQGVEGGQAVVAEYIFRGREAHPTTNFDPVTGLCDPHISYGYVADVALVQVDTETGQAELVKMWAAQDVGRAINPTMIEGQVEGGVLMGQGYALLEEWIQERGYIKTRNFTEYLIPTVLDVPKEIVSIIVEVPDHGGPFGAKGVGEMTTIGVAPAILNAIHDATGVWIEELPASAERIHQALKKKAGE
ncbi:MAG: xanthine dehydrogenase family protein, partial [Chloroflexi bacterium]|nr:xanthine dehydrogenase family protein [Chloroflexota bacterium]